MQFAKPKNIFLVVLIIALISFWEIFYKEHFPVVSNTANDTGYQINPQNRELVRLMDQSLSYKIHNQEIEQTAFLKNNDIRHYSMYVLPEFQLVSDKNGSDLLYYKKNKDIHMKIEFIPKHVHFALIKNNAKKELASLSNEKIFETSLEGQYLDESVKLEIFKDQEVINIYLLHYPDMKLKLTIFTSKDVDLLEPFIQMANTIMWDKTIK